MKTRMKTRSHIQAALLIVLAGIALIIMSCTDDSPALAAKVNDTGITLADLDSRVETVKAQYSAQGHGDPLDNGTDFRSQVLEDMISDQLLLDYADKSGYSIDDETVTGEISRIKEQFGSSDEYEEALKMQGFTQEALEKEIRKGMTIERMLEAEIASKIIVTGEEVEEFYAAFPQYFETPESVTASHIIVTVGPEESDEAKEKAREKIKAIREEIVRGADFAVVAREKSEGPSASSGGSLGRFTRGQMVASFEEAAFALAPGELSDIVVTEYGYHIILLEEKLPAGTMEIDQVSAEIQEYLRSVAAQKATEKLVDDLRAEASIEYFD